MTRFLAAAIATTVRFLPDVIDFTVIPNAAGTGGLLLALYGAARGFGPDRLGRLTLLGNLVGGVVALCVLLSVSVVHVLW